MMSYLHELAQDTANLLRAVAGALDLDPDSKEPRAEVLSSWSTILEDRADQLEEVCELAEPELWTAPPGNAPAAGGGVTAEELVRQLHQAHVDPPASAEVGKADIGDEPAYGLQIQEVLKNETGCHTFASAPAVLAIHLESVAHGAANLEVCVCDAQGEPVAGWFPAVTPGATWRLELARIDVAVQLNPPTSAEQKGG